MTVLVIPITRGAADTIAFDTPFLANPNPVERFRRDAPLNEANPDTFYPTLGQD